MLNSLDLLVIVFMVLVTGGLLSLCMMFLARNLKIKRTCFYIMAVLGVYVGYIGIRIGSGLFLAQTVIGAIVSAISIGAIVLTAIDRSNEKKFKIAQYIVSVMLFVGMVNAFI